MSLKKFDSAVNKVEAAVKALELLVLTESDPSEVDISEADVSEYAYRLMRLKDVSDRLKTSSGAVSRVLGLRMQAGEVAEIAKSSLEIEKRVGKERKAWQHRSLKTIVAEKLIDRYTDPSSGTLEIPVARLIEEALEFPGISYWKVTKLQELGIGADRYCMTKDGNTSFQIGKKLPKQESVEEDDFLED